MFVLMPSTADISSVRKPLRLHEVVRRAAAFARPMLEQAGVRVELDLVAEDDQLSGDCSRQPERYPSFDHRFGDVENICGPRSRNRCYRILATLGNPHYFAHCGKHFFGSSEVLFTTVSTR